MQREIVVSLNLKRKLFNCNANIYFNHDNQISLHFKPMRLIFDELQCLASSNSIIYLWSDDGLVIDAETCCHLVTLNKINIHSTSCVLACESLLLTCISPVRHHLHICCRQDTDLYSAINLTDKPTVEISLSSSVMKLYKMYAMYTYFLTESEHASVSRGTHHNRPPAPRRWTIMVGG
jgi:hypothetical protein